MSTADPTIDALIEMRRARRRKRIAQIHWVDAMYQVYITAIVGLVVLVLLSGAAGGSKLSPSGLADLLRRGPAILGLIPAFAFMAGLRSGSRGGPLALEQPDVRHVLMSGAPRGYVLRGPAIRQLRSFAFIGIVVGGAAGLFARHRLGSNPAELVACGACFGLASVLLGAGAALVAAGRRIPRWVATLVGGIVVVWSIADIAKRAPTAPMSFLGRMPLWPLRLDLLALAPAAVGVALAAFGLVGIAGLSIENAERRTKLVGQLRFAVTLQDLRTVLVLRRQLAQELPRENPWLGSGHYRRPPKRLVFSRGLRSVLRFPASRLVRLVVLAVIVGFSARGALDGAPPLAALAGLALWVAGLDAIEPLAQETDHPTRSESYPIEIGELLVRHLAAPALVMLIVSVVAAGVIVLAHPTVDSLRIAAIALVPMAMLGLAGAAVSALMGAPSVNDEISAMLPPEFAGMKNVLRAGWPPLVSILGVAPFLVVWASHRSGRSPWSAAATAAIAGVLVALFVAVWVRYRDDIHDWWKQSMEEAKQQKSSKDAARPQRASTRAAPAPNESDDDRPDDEWDEDDERDEDDDWDEEDEEPDDDEDDEPDPEAEGDEESK
ncbi:MAG: hypothetical protein JST73_09000 [Actinobacteria bacterium]|nr:hypothetical protein [Actinomycetota bacterium]